jgi:cytochrome P450/nitrite reductase/ring-hydroxylating ferredoxin subunit
MAKMVVVAQGRELRAGSPLALSVDGIDLVLLRTERGLKAYQGRCPHQGALLGEGELDGDTLVCRNHRWRFDVDSGARRGGPQCLTSCPVVEERGEIRVDASALAARPAEERATRQIRDLAGPRGWPLVGNTFQLSPSRAHEVFERWAAEHGPLFVVRVPGPVVVVSAPELCAQVLRARPETYRRASQIERVFEELGTSGVFSVEGAAWRAQRRLAVEALAPRHLRGFYPTLRQVTQRLCRRWERAADAGQPVEMVEELKLFTVDVTTALTFGRDFNTIEQTGDDLIQRRLELLFPAFNRRILAPIPFWRFIRLPSDRRLDRAMVELRVWIEGLVAETRTRLASEPERPPATFLEAMLAARDEAGQPFSDAVIFGNLMTMLLAGEDTTAYTLAWAIHELCDHPEGVAALGVEADAFPEAVPGSFEEASRLPYAGAVANEAMRLRPVAPILLMEAIADTTLGDLHVPAGTAVAVLTRPGARDAASFARPDAFQPERWLDPPLPGAHDPAVHIPFGTGPRICPGRSLALLEMRVLLSMLYGRFEVSREGQASDVRERFAFTMHPTGLKVRLRRRGAMPAARPTEPRASGGASRPASSG